MLIPWLLGLLGVLWFAGTRRSSRLSPPTLVACAIGVYLVAGVIAYFGLLFFLLGLSRGNEGVVPLSLIAFLKLTTLGVEIAISLVIVCWIAGPNVPGSKGVRETSEEPLSLIYAVAPAGQTSCTKCKMVFDHHTSLNDVPGVGFLCSECTMSLRSNRGNSMPDDGALQPPSGAGKA